MLNLQTGKDYTHFIIIIIGDYDVHMVTGLMMLIIRILYMTFQIMANNGPSIPEKYKKPYIRTNQDTSAVDNFASVLYL